MAINMFIIPHLHCFDAQFKHINSCVDSNLITNSNLIDSCSIVTTINVYVTYLTHVRENLFRIPINSGQNQLFSGLISGYE
jgi:hypothetical protein